MSGTVGVSTQFAGAVTATGLQLDSNFNSLVSYANDPTNRANYGTDGGTTNTLVINPSPPVVGGYSAGLTITFRAAFTNSGAVVANVSGIGNSSVLDQQGRQLTVSAIIGGSVYQMAYNGTSAFNLLSPNTILASQPALTELTSGAGTYTVSAGAVRIRVRGVGAGGGGGGATGNGGSGGATRFGTLFGDGGGAGGAANGTPDGGNFGTATGATINICGGSGQGGSLTSGGGSGGNSAFGGGGGGARGTSGTANANPVGINTGGGGGGAAIASSGAGGGGGGGYFEHNFVPPAATYTYTVGAAGTGGAGASGTTGSAGRIIIETFLA